MTRRERMEVLDQHAAMLKAIADQMRETAKQGTEERHAPVPRREPAGEFGESVGEAVMIESNPFRAKAVRAREIANRLGQPTAHDVGMASAFPLGGGYGRKGGERRIEFTVSRATRHIEANRKAEWLEAQADSFDRGEINAQGRSVNAASRARSDKRYAAGERRAVRIAAAKSECEGKQRHEVSAETWADAHGYLGGSARALVIHEHRQYTQAMAERNPHT